MRRDRESRERVRVQRELNSIESLEKTYVNSENFVLQVRGHHLYHTFEMDSDRGESTKLVCVCADKLNKLLVFLASRLMV